MRIPWTARRSNKSILKEISPEYSLEGLMLKLKLQYFDHLVQRTDSLEKSLRSCCRPRCSACEVEKGWESGPVDGEQGTEGLRDAMGGWGRARVPA